VILYDDTVKIAHLTSDECDLLITLLEAETDNCLSIAEEITVNELIRKLN